MSEKQNASSNQTILSHVRKAPLPHAVFFDVLGLILVLVGALYTHYREGSSTGEVVFWVGIVLLIVALIIFVWSGMRKPNISNAQRPVSLFLCFYFPCLVARVRS